MADEAGTLKATLDAPYAPADGSDDLTDKDEKGKPKDSDRLHGQPEKGAKVPMSEFDDIEKEVFFDK